MKTQDVKLTGFNPTAGGPSGNLFSRIAVTLSTWQTRARQRSDLAGMTEAQLKDVGLSNADVWRELKKPFWSE